MKEIDGKGKSVRDLLNGKRYYVDYYQREYKWQTKHVRELIEDLTTAFLEDYDPKHGRKAVAKYGHYFLGSIIISDKEGERFIIDGQQRLTTLTLLLIYLHRRQADFTEKVKLDDLIFSEKFGEKRFNIDVKERTKAMEALFVDGQSDEEGQPESVRNIINRYNDIKALFPEEINDVAVPYFADWIIENVHLVEIIAQSDDDAYTIFVTMNDRGLSLTPTDMLKGYLLANIEEGKDRNQAGETWKKRTGALIDFGKEEDADAIKTWLRSQYAESIRERKAGATPADFDRLGTEFHRWVRENAKKIGLSKSADFADFIETDFDFYSRQYLRVRHASYKLTPGLETVFYNAQQDFTLQYPLLLAALKPTDSDEEIARKLRVVSSFIDILLARRLWNFKSISYSTMQYSMFLVMKSIRGRASSKLPAILAERLKEEPLFKSTRFSLHERNRPVVKQFLARMTDHVERESGTGSNYVQYATIRGKKGYEVEHIWSDHADDYAEFTHPADFADYRNRIGGLLLLPKSFNASYGDVSYEEKLPHYFGQNLLAKSLHPKCYDHNPGFLKYLKLSKLPFEAHKHFLKADLDQRQALYTKLAEEIWSASRLTEAVK
jgi:uncharacterized protein with ParB-like and HNH nuclease domain